MGAGKRRQSIKLGAMGPLTARWRYQWSHLESMASTAQPGKMRQRRRNEINVYLVCQQLPAPNV